MDWAASLEVARRRAPELVARLGLSAVELLRAGPPLIELARVHPDATLLEAPEGALTGAGLQARAHPLALALRSRGLRPGVSAATALRPGLDEWVLATAIGAAGGTWMPLGPDLAPDALHALVLQAGPRFVFTGASSPAPALAAQSPGVQDWFDLAGGRGLPSLDDLEREGRVLAAGGVLLPRAVLSVSCRTRGTAGPPRVVPGVGPVSPWAALGILDALAPSRTDRLHLAMAPYRPPALAVALVHLWVGATLDLGPGEGATVAVRTPQATSALDASGLRAVVCAGGPLSADARAAFAERTRAELHLAYASAETGVCAWLGPADAAEHPLASGRALPGVELAIRDGAVCARNLPRGPWRTAGDRGALEGDLLTVWGRADRARATSSSG